MTDPTADKYPPAPTDEDVLRETKFLAETLYIWKEALKDGRKKQNGEQQKNNGQDDWNPNFDIVVLTNVARSWLDDIWRYEVYHIGKDAKTHANAIKRGAYLTKWICRLRPMYVHRPVEKLEDVFRNFDPTTDDSLLINEALSLHLSLQMLAQELDVADIVLQPDFYDRLIYGLHFRHFHEDSVLELYEIIYDEIKGKRVTVP